MKKIELRQLGIAAILLLCAVSCQTATDKKVNELVINKSVPLWLSQNIDKDSSCNLILITGMTLIKVGESFTVVYDDGLMKWYKSDKKRTGLDFDYNARGLLYYSDTCLLKEDLRGFIKLQMVKAIEANLYNNAVSK